MTEKPIAIVKRFSVGGFRIIALARQPNSLIALHKSFPTST
jgi:hypothetical protein